MIGIEVDGRWHYGVVGTRSIYDWVEHDDIDASAQNYAPGMTFSIYEPLSDEVAERTISGKVFQDKDNDDENRKGEIIGNGLYDGTGSKNENLIQNAKVELLEKDKKTVANQYRYKTNDDGSFYVDINGKYEIETDPKKKIATVYTDNIDPTNRDKGINYEFKGIIPGEYYIRFTYGDGTQEIYDSSGKKVSNEKIKSYNYKSTIINENAPVYKILKEKSSSVDWHRDKKMEEGYSVAVDDLATREDLNEDSNKSLPISAYTPKFEITFEEEEFVDTKYHIENMNFGIIETPKIKLGFEKVMTNIKVTNTSGQVIMDVNPGDINQNVQYLSNLDSNENHLVTGSDYAKIEINNEEIYGAKLEITYALTLINNSDINYYEYGNANYGYYYKFGEIANNAAEVNLTIKEIRDYLDDKLTLTGNSKSISNKDNYKEDGHLTIKDSGSEVTWNNIYSRIATDDKEIKYIDDNGKTYATRSDGKIIQDTAKVVLTRTLSNTDTDMDFTNTAEVIDIEVTGKPALVEDINEHSIPNNRVKYDNYFVDTDNSNVKLKNPSDGTFLTIVPPTGADMMTIMIYIFAIAISGIIITIGIIVIKKKVLNK